MNACHPGLAPAPRPKAPPALAARGGLSAPRPARARARARARLRSAASSHHFGLLLFGEENSATFGASKGQITGRSPRQMGI